jgi:hypothetical protein
MLATVEENPAEYEEDEEVLPLWRILSWFIMKKRKESRRRRRRNISPSQSSTSWRRVWIKRLDQFNKYKNTQMTCLRRKKKRYHC